MRSRSSDVAATDAPGQCATSRPTADYAARGSRGDPAGGTPAPARRRCTTWRLLDCRASTSSRETAERFSATAPLPFAGLLYARLIIRWSSCPAWLAQFLRAGFHVPAASVGACRREGCWLTITHRALNLPPSGIHPPKLIHRPDSVGSHLGEQGLDEPSKRVALVTRIQGGAPRRTRGTPQGRNKYWWLVWGNFLTGRPATGLVTCSLVAGREAMRESRSRECNAISIETRRSFLDKIIEGG